MAAWRDAHPQATLAMRTWLEQHPAGVDVLLTDEPMKRPLRLRGHRLLLLGLGELIQALRLLSALIVAATGNPEHDVGDDDGAGGGGDAGLGGGAGGGSRGVDGGSRGFSGGDGGGVSGRGGCTGGVGTGVARGGGAGSGGGCGGAGGVPSG